jgi:hypothetical protein
MTKNGYMKGFYGPYYRSSENDKWHWRVECPHFPSIDNPQTKISTEVPHKEILCHVCDDIEINYSADRRNNSQSNYTSD